MGMSVLIVTAMDPDHVSSCDQIVVKLCPANSTLCTYIDTNVRMRRLVVRNLLPSVYCMHYQTNHMSPSPLQGTHAEFSFSFENLLIVSAPLPFEISHDRLSGEGTISVSDPLDFETTDRYVFRVSATYYEQGTCIAIGDVSVL